MSCDNDCSNCESEECIDGEGASKEAETKINKELVDRLNDKDKEKETLIYIC